MADPTGATGPFGIDQLEKLEIRVDCEHLQPGDHIVRVDVISPEGTLYAQVPGTLAASDAGTGSGSAVLQVRGSTIDSFREQGAWHLVANVDGMPLAAAAVDFTE